MNAAIKQFIDTLEDEIKKKETSKAYKPKKILLDKIGSNPNIVNCMATTCEQHIAYGFAYCFDSLFDFIGIKSKIRIESMSLISKNKIEQKILDNLRINREKNYFCPRFFRSNVFPMYQRLELLFDTKEAVLLTDEECLAMYDACCIHFEFMLKAYLKLPINEELIKKTYRAILFICTPTYSASHRAIHQLSYIFLLQLSFDNESLHKELLKLASDWDQKNKRVLVNTFSFVEISEYTYLLTDEELANLKQAYYNSETENYHNYKNGVSKINNYYSILSKMKAVESWTNK